MVQKFLERERLKESRDIAAYLIKSRKSGVKEVGSSDGIRVAAELIQTINQ
jgi:hypothetical protein